MRRVPLLASLGLIALGLLAAPGCDGDDDPGPSASTTNQTDTNTEEGDMSLPGLEAQVDVTVDDRGMPHIYGASLHDVAMVEGYLMARDRFPMMEFVRRNVTGRLAEFLGTLSPDALEADIAARVIGYQRVANRIYDGMEPTEPTRVALDAFAAGVNVYIQELRDGTTKLPRGAGLLDLFLLPNKEAFTDWTPQDSLAIGRYLSSSLSYEGDTDIAITAAAAAAAAAYPAGDPREGIFRDFWSMDPARDVFTRDGFPNVGTDGGTSAKPSPPPGPSPAPQPVSLGALQRSLGFANAAKRHLERFGDETRGSNNWIVSGAKTASGFPIIANDPHLSLPSPPLFWYAHLNTTRAGGDLNVQGLSLVGVPGVIIGYNDHVAWGVTTAGHDVTDVYSETITPGAGDDPDTVLFNGNQVPIQIITETIKVSGEDDVVLHLENVPHHGVIVPQIVDGKVVPRTEDTALSVRWTGDEPSYEVRAFFGLNVAKDLDDAKAAIDHFEVGAQSFVITTTQGEIFWSTQARVPVRPAEAMTYDPETQTGVAPFMVLPGDGSAEWTGDLDDSHLPHDLNPARGFIATANNDLVGATLDGNPFNDPYYVGWDYDIGHRVARITERLDQLTTAGGVTPEDMMSIQADHQSPLGRHLTPALIASLERVAEERATPGTHADLADLVAATPAADLDLLDDVVARLGAWSFETATGVDIGDGAPGAAEVNDAIATSLFNATITQLAQLAFGDESTAIGSRPGSGAIAKTLQWALLTPERLVTYDGVSDTVLWDDVSTAGVTETRHERIARAALQGIATLRGTLGDDASQWTWGKLHTVRLTSLVPDISGTSAVDVPPADDPAFPGGFPRPGDNFGVDASNFGMWTNGNFTFGSGPVQRMVVEMTPDGPRAWNAIPGGQAFDPESPHHADEVEHWRRNNAPPLYFTDDDVDAHMESRATFTP
ncbi:penicillin acylase family protein [Chondromyces apiculatus]|uniref:Penicillin acylase family protein n=1 Tax=Chondromyces apiculatus DSM 436 TaxID=1192034 RepID=A0A017TD65_9BACT|nr:penicillin acylase family protein [Chondromyces apiculatus]EYF07174.1 Hypothetical protein CAP_0653 [Chondromyces apiculatus DSM 436]